MSLQIETAGQALGAFWHSIRGTRRRDPSPAAGAIRPSAGDSRADLHHRAEIRPKVRPVIRAEDLADSYIKALASGSYAFRVLKTEFDELCAEAEIAPVSDKQFAHWLLARGHKKYRDGYPKVTRYKIVLARRSRAA